MSFFIVDHALDFLVVFLFLAVFLVVPIPIFHARWHQISAIVVGFRSD